jgi:hypothetical protein
VDTNTERLKRLAPEATTVIAIIAILVAILLPALAAAKRKAQTAQCGNNLGNRALPSGFGGMTTATSIPCKSVTSRAALRKMSKALLLSWQVFLDQLPQLTVWGWCITVSRIN